MNNQQKQVLRIIQNFMIDQLKAQPAGARFTKGNVIELLINCINKAENDLSKDNLQT